MTTLPTVLLPRPTRQGISLTGTSLTPEERRRRTAALEHLAFPAGLAGRLRQEQGWSRERTEEVLGEYRRFLILAATQGVSVTPSQTVDHAWHAHLEYTAHYWERLCGDIIGEPLHHTPGEPGDEAHFRQAYLDTLDLYRTTFGERPPESVWPDPRRRAQQTAGTEGPAMPRPGWPRWLFGGLVLLVLWALLGSRLPLLIPALVVLLVAGQVTRRPRLAAGRSGDATTSTALPGDGGAGHHGHGGDGGHAGCGSSCGSSCGGGCGS